MRQSEAKYRSLFDSIDEGFCILELLFDDEGNAVNWIYLETNRAFEGQTGFVNAVGKRISELQPDMERSWFEQFARIARTGEPLRFIDRTEAMDRWYDVYALRVGAVGDNRISLLFRDITDRKRREANLAFLASIETEFARFTSSSEIANVAGDRIVEYFNLSHCLLVEIDDQTTVATVFHDHKAADLPTKLGNYLIQDFHTEAEVEQLAAGQPLVINDALSEQHSQENAARFEALGNRSLVTAPYLRDGRWKFALSAQDREPRLWRQDEIEFLQELAMRVSLRIERARAEVTLRESEEKFRAFLSAASDIIYEMSADWREMRSLEGKEFIATTEDPRRDWTEAYIPETDKPRVRAAINRAIATRSNFELEHRVIRLDGTVGWTFSRAIPLINEAGEIVKWFGAASDITDQVEAEAALRESEIQRVREQSAREQERQRAVREAARSADLAELDRAKTLFFSNVSHEFRTPLTLILASVQDALSDSVNPLTSSQRERLELVHHNSLRLLKLVNTLLDFSRIEADRLKANYEPTDLSTYTAELASVFRSAIENANLQLVVDCPPLPDPIYVDREMWEKIVLNLLSNALKFTFEGMISVSLKFNANTVELMVSDTGVGISASELPHLFERFYQVKGARGRSSEGSGIGLSLVQELVKRHGGAIAVTSAVDQGTTFTVTIPTGIAHLPADQIWVASTLISTAVTANAFVEEALRWLPEESTEFQAQSLEIKAQSSEIKAQSSEIKAQSSEVKAQSSEIKAQSSEIKAQSSEVKAQSPEIKAQSSEVQVQSSKRARILLVDDNADMRGYLKRLLSQYYEVETVNDGLAALTAIRRGGSAIYDLVLADVMMPRMDGFELLRSLRTSPNTQTIPIILLSARAGEESRVQGLETGADDYLIKPFSARELLARVNANLQLAQLRREAVYREQVMQAVQTLNERLEQQVKARTAQLEAINQELEAFSSSISHDLRTPLRYISSFAEQLQGKLNATLVDASSLQTLNIITKSALETEKMVDDLLEFSHLGKTEMHLTTVNITKLVQQVREQLQPELIGRSLHWEIEPLVTVEGDPALLRSVLQNLLSNAVKYSRNNTEAAITIGSIEQEQEVIFFVKDNGAGFDMKYCDRLFSIFQRLHPQEQFPGTGVGLATVRRIIHRHGGRIWAEGAIDQGATFYFSLPKRKVYL
ncbi:ATP-binding protein [Nostoc sp.]|uniref:ATP-binding protein n=1 Tax=Nostoc sp. TaxID=1180 RepID=UPI003FA52718